MTDITRYVFVQYFFMTHDLSHNSLCKQELKVLNNCQEAASSSIWIFSILLRLSNWHSTEKKGGIRSKQIHLWHPFKQNKLKFSSKVKVNFLGFLTRVLLKLETMETQDPKESNQMSQEKTAKSKLIM